MLLISFRSSGVMLFSPTWQLHAFWASHRHNSRRRSAVGEVLICSCCSSEAPRTSPQEKHSLSSGMWLLLLYALSGLDGWQPSVGRADTHSHRWADVPVGARFGGGAPCRGSSDTEIKGLCKVRRVSSELKPRRRLSFFPLCVPCKKCVCCQSAILRRVRHDQGQSWYNHTLATAASHDHPPTTLFVPAGSLEKEVEESSAIVNTLNKSFIFGRHAADNQYGGWLWVCTRWGWDGHGGLKTFTHLCQRKQTTFSSSSV